MPFAHQADTRALRLLTHDLLEIDQSQKRGSKWVSFVNNTWEFMNSLYGKRDPRIKRVSRDGIQLDAHVMEREIYFHIDALRVSHAPWAKNASVLKTRLSGGRQGTNQLSISFHILFVKY